ncbi:spore coat U domain-containing protein [Luteibacter aegosomaticola]|uniref:Csu type fimbrial protein n=1 Tax=Luteibacter aegosomaticola TaxID=2911538 RepID=UPI001FF7BDBA|nr:spore coat U domain-containing protein [Luteibacter aegosomaticola]UPG92138.1 spore coat U domain-containing protein [Luteibacter aegosomaticola]
MRNALLKSGLVAATLLAAGGAASAGTATSNLDVSATVAASCTIDATGGLAFGTYDPVVTNKATALDGQGTINTVCTNGATAVVTLDEGSHADDASTPAAPVRRMLAGTNQFLSYNLYTDNAHGTVWNGTTGQDVTGSGDNVATTVYGSIPAGQNASANTYNDTVKATITF